MRKGLADGLLCVVCCLFGSLLAEAAGTATVVRSHPRLTRGLEKEALLGIRFDDNWGGAPSALNLHFDFTNCTRSVIRSIEVWYQKSPAYAFCPNDEANRLVRKSLDSDDLEIAGLTQWIYPKNQNNADSDYLWFVAAIDPDLPATAEIRVSLTNDEWNGTLDGQGHTLTIPEDVWLAREGIDGEYVSRQCLCRRASGGAAGEFADREREDQSCCGCGSRRRLPLGGAGG